MTDVGLILAARGIRTFAYGYLSVLLGVYLEQIGVAPWQVGALLTTTLAGSAVLTLGLSAAADRWGRRPMLMASALLMAASGAAFAATARYPLLILASLTGTIGVTSGEVGPFLSLEQATLTQAARPERRNAAFGWYNTVGALSGALGALFAGTPALLQAWLGWSSTAALRVMFVLYAAIGLVGFLLFARLSAAVEVASGSGAAASARGMPARGGLGRSRAHVLRLAALFGLDSLAGGFVVQSLIAFWFHLRWGAGPEVLGPIFLGVGLLQAVSFLIAARLADRFGLINTMVFTHLPSNVLLMLIPAAPTLSSAVILLLARHALSQMDVPTRQSYVMAVVDPEERNRAAAVTHVVRNAAQAVTPIVSGYAMQGAALGLPFVVGGALKSAYDIILYVQFRHLRPPEERAPRR
ncbi:MAG: MFS transporter [Armatimonadota bacterium]|nr:MFS transporter [Armatimonadota bacterium]MDR7451700.1 MFS transporter [Armatimonadota bacterium]MDR7465682.1 MFS transporter [Armatimonadota bacterium]MDR7493591.1 MFS transporter [Armatimonadota bacterium]MDR7499505.1 MFS transporter [Armatimonadota bacterium]